MKKTVGLICFTIFTGMVFAEYSVDWQTVDGGGGVCRGGPYVLSGTIGQPEAAIVSGGDYVLSGGFWAGTTGCVVNLTDLTIFVDQWLSTDPLAAADFDTSGRVDLADFSELAFWWLQACPAGWTLK